ncbi:MAG: T9SS type A sorting domain-containing protein [Chitinophagales bacterium]
MERLIYTKHILVIVAIFCLLPVKASVLSAELYFKRDSLNPARYTTYLKCYTFYKPNGLDSVHIDWGDNTNGRLFLTGVDSVNPNLFSMVFTGMHTYLPGTQNATMAVWWLNRVADIVNYYGTESEYIPLCLVAETNIASMQTDFSPVFTKEPEWLSTNTKPYIAAIPVADADNDSLVFEAMVPLQDTNLQVPLYMYPNEVFIGPGQYTYNISNDSGIVSWISPYHIGIYNVAVRVKEYRNGIFMGAVMRDFNIYIDSPSGIAEKPDSKAEEIKIMANGVVISAFHAQLSNNTEGSIFNLEGQLLQQLNANNNTIDVSFLPPGLFILQLKSGTQQVVRKFVKE